MSDKKSLTLIKAALIAIPLMVVLVQAWGTPIEDVIAGVFVYALFGVLLVSYLLRFALIFFGVFALYRMLQKRYYRQAGV